jgi:hypothetical protein
VRESHAHGDVSRYNSFNRSDIAHSPLAEYLRGLDLDGKRIYSNGSDTAWFILRRRIDRAPTLRTADRLAELQKDWGVWPGLGREGYLIWVQGEVHKAFYATPAELATIADVQQVFSDENGTVYSVSAD